jgi:glutamate 5-kinase
MSTKLEAARLATASGVDVVIANGAQEEVILRLARGDDGIGTRFPSSVTKMDSRKRWMLSGLSTRGEIIVDEGAATALRRHHRSLLPAGITGVSGSFERGDIIAIVGPSRDRIASGLTNYGSADLATIRGAHSDRISELLGHEYGDEAVHRNNMIVA